MFNHLYIYVAAPLEFVLSLARVSKVRLKRVQKAEKGCYFYIPAKDFLILKNTLDKQKREYSIEKNYGVKTFFSRNIVRYGFYAGILIAVVVMFFYSANATRLQISGNTIIETQIIYDTVNNIVDLPSPKKNIDRAEIIRKIVALDGISNASVEVRGNTVLVNVYEELAKVKISDPSDYSPIVSLYDALITRVVTYSGGAVVKKGQAVRKGDNLITSDIVLDEGLIAKEKALGDVYGRVWYTKSLVLTPTVIFSQRTGKTEVYNYTFFNTNKQYNGKLPSFPFFG